MTKIHLLWLAGGVALGYFMAAKLSGKQPWSTAYSQGAGLA